MIALLVTLTGGVLAPTDRPDMTESAYAVPIGNVQVETEAVSIEKIVKEGVSIGEVVYLNSLIKTGIFKNADVHFGWTGLFSHQEFVFRFRYSYVSEGFALAVLPHVGYDYLYSQKVDYFGISFPFQADLSERFSIGSMYSYFRMGNENNHFATLSLGFSWDKMSLFVETALQREQTWTVFVNSGIAIQPVHWFQIDAGGYYNITKKALISFVGVSFAVSFMGKS